MRRRRERGHVVWVSSEISSSSARGRQESRNSSSSALTTCFSPLSLDGSQSSRSSKSSIGKRSVHDVSCYVLSLSPWGVRVSTGSVKERDVHTEGGPYADR